MKIKDLILQIESLNSNQVLEYLVKKAEKSGRRTFVVTINPELVMLAKTSSEYEKVLKFSDLTVADGIGIIWAGKIFGKKFPERIHGVDLVEKLSEAVSNKPITVGLVGGRENVAQLSAECLKSKYPNLKIAFAMEEMPGLEADINDELRIKNKDLRKGPNQSSKIVNRKSSIINPSCDILFVAFGSPKQELWIYKHLDQIDTKVAIGVGGAFDFISGRVSRAPVWVRKIGMEWLFRLIIQPWRIKRQLALPRFVLLVLKERFL